MGTLHLREPVVPLREKLALWVTRVYHHLLGTANRQVSTSKPVLPGTRSPVEFMETDGFCWKIPSEPPQGARTAPAGEEIVLIQSSPGVLAKEAHPFKESRAGIAIDLSQPQYRQMVPVHQLELSAWLLRAKSDPQNAEYTTRRPSPRYLLAQERLLLRERVRFAL